ncbi:MAG: phosphotransferase family protein [Geminicoccaceae bacterium]
MSRLLEAADLCWSPRRFRSKPIMACFPEATRGQLHWCALAPRLPVLSMRDHLLETLLLARRQKVFDHDRLAAALIDRARGLIWLDQLTFGFVHNDLGAGNILLAGDRIAVVDFAGACVSNPFVDPGGLLAELGLVALDHVVYWSQDRGKHADEHRIRKALEFFCLKRSLRHLVHLSRLGRQENPDHRPVGLPIAIITALFPPPGS